MILSAKLRSTATERPTAEYYEPTAMNRLAREGSPYLQQHAHQPVDWYPWGEEALQLARQEDKPILLSIGYSACHWCHVMAQECFEDEAVALLMNRLFINIKVDREERPDLDQVYQTAHQMLLRQPGGWPLTMFLTPQALPFFGGTYFPREARHGLPAFADLLQSVAQAYREKPAEIAEQNQAILDAFASTLPAAVRGTPVFNADPLAQAVAELDANFDRRRGGFGGAPKFPRPLDLDFLLRRHAATGDPNAREMALATLERMAEGGIHDHLGGGFFRYSTDAYWTIPHFEKMLSDNGLLLGLYADAWALSHKPVFQWAVSGIVTWLEEEMQLPEGGFAAALDADSEGEEGRFYLWTPAEIHALLAPEEWTVAAAYWGLESDANFEGREWHLRQVLALEQVAEQRNLSLNEARARLASARQRLLRARNERRRPGRDDKLLTGWNALAIRGLARAARALGRPEWLGLAYRAMDAIRRELWRNERLLASWKDGKPGRPAFLDDYAFLLLALLELLQAGWRDEDYRFATELAEGLLQHFEDPADGGFFFTAHDDEPLIHRPKPLEDHATPSGNGAAAFALGRFALLNGERRHAEAARRTLALFLPELRRQPSAYPGLLNVLGDELSPPALAVLQGPGTELPAWLDELGRLPAPWLLAVAPTGKAARPETLHKPASSHVNAWVCCGVTCLPPIDGLEPLLGMLAKPLKVH
jgi:uncharacterized protein YyaL (SSP411 family)